MSKDLNQCNFIGRLGKDPDIKYMPNGNAVVNFSLACGDDYKDKNTGEKRERTNWINVVIFGKLAEIVGEYCEKGSKVFVSGKQTTRKWQDQTGADRYSTEIVASDLQMLDSPTAGAQQNKPAQSQHDSDKANGYQPDDFDDDIPW